MFPYETLGSVRCPGTVLFSLVGLGCSQYVLGLVVPGSAPLVGAGLPSGPKKPGAQGGAKYAS